MNYRPEIDGLRALAVLPVILFHAGFSVFSGGFVGVDIFFVISGYLITTILFAEMDAGTYSLLGFYERRARRILPALFVVMLACIPFAWVFMLQTELKDFFESLAATALFVSNILYWSESGYFAAVAEKKPLLHTWSLAVEEQYYLLFPPLLWLAMKFGHRAALALILIAATVSLAWAIFGKMTEDARFFLSHTRLWELLAGSLCAYLLRYGSVRQIDNLALLGLGFITFSVFAITEETPYPAFAVVPVFGTMLIILFAKTESWAGEILSARVLVGIGLISFSAYLWHHPLFAFARIVSIGPPPGWLMGLLAALSLGLAYLTWAWIEQPFRGKPARYLPGRGPLLAASLAGIVVFTGLGVYGNEKDGFPEREVVRSLNEPMIDARFERFRTWDVLDGVVPARFDLTRFSDDPDTRKLLLLGDSHSKGLFNAIYQNPELFPDIEVRRVALDGDCYVDGSEDCFETMVNASAALFAEATHVMLIARWHRPNRLPALNAVLPRLQAMGKPVILVGMTAEYDIDGPVIIADIARDIGFDGTQAFPVADANAIFHAHQSTLARATDANMRALAEERGLPYRDRHSLICSEEACTGVTPDGKAVTYDYGHWTLAGSKYFGTLIAERNWLDLP